MKIQTRLLLSFAAVAVVCAIVGLVGWRGISKTSDIVEKITGTNLPEIEGLGMVMEGANAVKSGQRTMIIRRVPHKERAAELEKNLKRMEGLDEGWKLYCSTEKEAEEQAMVTEASAALAAWKADNEKLNTMVRSLRTEEGADNEAVFSEMLNLAFGDLRTTFSALEKKLDALNEKSVAMAHAEAESAAATASSSTLISIISMLVGIICAMGLGFVIARQISQPVMQGVGLAEEIAKGVFTSRLRLNRKDEIGQLAAALDHMAEALARQTEVARTIAAGNLTCKVELSSPQDTLGQALQTMQQSLSDTISQTKMAGEEIANGALQIADSSQSLAQGASEQASSLEEISSAMTQMSSQTKMTADSARQAQELSNTARDAADQGNQQMQQMIGAMEEIRVSSQSVANVIKVIEEIAFQTNMLALNAAVEAAHAGQHGKGFAVVAEEVRNLAARSAKAAKETADLIAGSVAKTENGARIADQTAAALAEINTRIAQAADLVQSIAQAAQEQSQGIAQVSQGLHQIDQVTQQNSANAEQGAAASEELSGQAAHLRQLMQKFKVGAGTEMSYGKGQRLLA